MRRLLANAPTSTRADKISIVRRVIVGAAAAGAPAIVLFDDPHRIAHLARATALVEVPTDFHPAPGRHDENDSIAVAAGMRAAGCAVVVVLGGDGTSRAVALGWPDAPILALSTGTNNAFPRFIEATVAGSVAGLLGAGRLAVDEVASRAKVVHLEVDGEADEFALIDAVLLDEDLVGSAAPFTAGTLRAAVVSRAEPAAVGMAAVAGLVHPASADDDYGVSLCFAPGTGRATRTVVAPLAPGAFAPVDVMSGEPIELGAAVTWTGPGVLALDGERRRAIAAGQQVTVRVRRDGPWAVDAPMAMRLAAERRLFG